MEREPEVGSYQTSGERNRAGLRTKDEILRALLRAPGVPHHLYNAEPAAILPRDERIAGFLRAGNGRLHGRRGLPGHSERFRNGGTVPQRVFGTTIGVTVRERRVSQKKRIGPPSRIRTIPRLRERNVVNCGGNETNGDDPR